MHLVYCTGKYIHIRITAKTVMFTGTEVTIVISIIHWMDGMLIAQVHRDGVGHDHIQVKVGLMMS